MAQAWHLFLASQPVYQHLVINNTPDLDTDQVLAATIVPAPHGYLHALNLLA